METFGKACTAGAHGGMLPSQSTNTSAGDSTILDRLRPEGYFAKVIYCLKQWALDYPQSRWISRLLQYLPILTLGKWVGVFRYDEVREVLGRQSDFAVPFGEKMEELNGGPNFLLGMQDGPEYRRCQELVMRAFSREDASKITRMAADYAQIEIANALKQPAGRLDAVQDLITLVATRICEDYYGVPIHNKVEFAGWTMAMSGFTFGPPGENPRTDRVAREAGELVRPVIDCAIARAKAGHVKPDTVLARLIAMQMQNTDLTDPIVRSYLIGMITGFVPTSTIATANMLEMLLRRPDFMVCAWNAAKDGDDNLLRRCLFEALRFKPINPGPFRICGESAIIAKGTPRQKVIRKGKILLASTQSAMLDGRRIGNPYRFDPDRPAQDYMNFGYGLHWCVGVHIAEIHFTQVLKALLLQEPCIERVPGKQGKLETIGVFPVHLEVQLPPKQPTA